MFDELKKYKNNDHFFFQSTQDLEAVCNAPTNRSGIFLVYALKGGRIEPVYIGHSGEIKDGLLVVNSKGLGGLKEEIVNGLHMAKLPRKMSWVNQIRKENIEALDVYWYSTHESGYIDNPKVIEKQILKIHGYIYDQPPRWNIIK